MKLASYKGSRSGIYRIGNALIRWRFAGPYSHNEVVFEPGDGVDSLMPDKTCSPTGDGYWCASSVALETMPAWSPYRAGRTGGVRFKRRPLFAADFDLIPVNRDPAKAATWFADHQGEPYSWRLVAEFISWLVSMARGTGEWACSHACAAAFGHEEPWRFDPVLLAQVEKDR